MRVSAPLRIANTLVALFALISAPLGADSRFRVNAETEGNESCKNGGETQEYFQGRYQWYIETYGENGVFNPDKRLLQLHEAYGTFLKERAAKRGKKPEAAASLGAFKFLGPNNGAGRATAVELHPTDPNIVYVGAAGGGCWKSTDGGTTWRALTDGLADLSVGAVAIAPSNPSIVYLGTGEGGYATDFIPGIGVFRSTDAGETWKLPGSVVAPLVYRISVDPRNADTVLAFTNNGVQRSTDGGTTWARTSDPGFGDATDVARDSTNPDILHATFWIATALPDSGTYAKSTDAGKTWTPFVTGLPADPKARMSIALSSDGKTLYSMVTGTAGGNSPYAQLGLYRSTDSGATWAKAKLQNPNNQNRVPNILSGQGWYDNCVAVDTESASTVYIGGGGAGLWASTDSGDTVTEIGSSKGVHVDHHQLVVKRYSASLKVFWSANDGGVWSSTNGGTTWTDRNTGLATRQYYSVSIDPARANIVYAGAQDNGTNRIDTSTLQQTTVIGGDGFESAVDPDSPHIIYGNPQYNSIYRSVQDGDPDSFGYAAQPFAGGAFSSSGPNGPRPFLSWITLDPNNPKTVYSGTSKVFRSDDAGETWQALSADAFNNSFTTRALAVAKGNGDRILVAQSNRIFLTNDRGRSFVQLTNGLPGASPSPIWKNVEIDPSNQDAFWVASSNSSSTTPGRVFKSTDGGATFVRADSGLPDFAVESVRVDPGDSATIYAGTLVGLYRSTNGGTTWNRFGDGLPAAAVHEVRVSPDGARVFVATHGRGVWGANGLNPNRPPSVTITSPTSTQTVNPGQAVTFSGSASDPDNDPLTLRWTFGDNQGLSLSYPSANAVLSTAPIVYRTPGTYIVSLVAIDSKGGRGVAFTRVTVTPPNDACANATPIPLVPDQTVVLRTSSGGSATTDASDPTPPILPGCVDPTYVNSLWFTLTPPVDGTLDVDTLGSLGDTIAALYPGPCNNLGTALGCNDDATSLGINGGPSVIPTLNVKAGTTYRLLVGTWAQDASAPSPIDALHVRAKLSSTTPDFQTAGTTSVLPVVLDAYGKNGARFQSDLVFLNKSASPLGVGLSFGGNTGLGEATSALLIPPGAQIRVPDALAELRRQGVAVPLASPSNSQVGSLTALVGSGDPNALVLASRTASPNPNTAVGGTFGLFENGVSFANAADSDTVYIYGLRQTDTDRANLALVHVRTPHAKSKVDNAITLSVEVFDANGNPSSQNPKPYTLQPGEWTQINEVLSAFGVASGAANGGYVRIKRNSGEGRFVAYGVVNDQKTADGSFIEMTKSGSLKASDSVLVPVVLEAGGVGGSFFTSELVLANRSAKNGTAVLRYVPSSLFSGVATGSVNVSLAAGAQKVIPNLLQFLRTSGIAIPTGVAQGGSLFVTFNGFDAGDDVYAGSRTSTPNPDATQGGAFGVFLPGIATSGLFSDSATVAALRQDASVRSNLAVVNAGTSAITLSVQLKSVADGGNIGSPLIRPLQPGEWYQWSNVIDTAGAGVSDAYAVVTRTAGTAGWFTYAALNDAKTSDGSVIAGVK